MADKEWPDFKTDPRGWARRMLDALGDPALKLKHNDLKYVALQRRLLASNERRTPSDFLYDRLWRIAARCGLVERRRLASSLKRVRRDEVAQARAVAVPPAHALYAPIRKPPPLRRPVVALGGGSSETWDPAGSPGL